MHHPPAPVCAVCGHPGRLFLSDDGYTVECSNKYCEGVPALSATKAVDTKDAAWNQWTWEQTGVCR
jgi:hypothetical protein